ncbi:MAG: hypothetical protein M3Q49_10270 [Actinomycetota bacterium]|nr:hypothetical protein [Actinomycetota bacterium]
MKRSLQYGGTGYASASPVLEDFVTHASRTTMLSELLLLLEAVPAGSSPDGYRSAVLDENVLLKGAATTRTKSLRHLRELYVLREEDARYGALRTLWDQDPPSRPLLALLCAVSRDELLRATAELVIETPGGAAVNAGMLSGAVAESFPDRLAPGIVAKVGRNAASSWTQSGHLQGRAKKVRARAAASIGAVVYALMLGHLSGVRGLPLYETLWARLLDAPANEIDALAFAASQRGLLEYRRMGDVAEFGFSGLLGGERG